MTPPPVPPPPRRREGRVLAAAAAVVVAVAVLYLLVGSLFETAPQDPPPVESPGTEAPFGTEKPAPAQDG